MADYYRDESLEWELSIGKEYLDGLHCTEIWVLYQKNKLKWTTKEKEKILVKNMSDEHVVNTKNFLVNKKSDNTAVAEWIDVFNAEIEKRKL